MDQVEVNPRKSWVVAPCFLQCLFLSKEKVNSEIDEDISFLLLQRKSMNIVLDMEDSGMGPSFLFTQYKKIRENLKEIDPQNGKYFGKWIKTLKREGRLEFVEINDYKFSDKLEAILSKAKVCPKEAHECFANCIKMASRSKDNLLLTGKKNPIPIWDNNLDNQFGIWVFNRNKAEKFISSPENFESSAAIQDALINYFLRHIKHRKEILQDIKLLYKNYTANGPLKPQPEKHVGERLFNDLILLIGNCNLDCAIEPQLSNARADAIISSGRYKVIIELKWTHSDLKDGLIKQLPDYLVKKGIKYGIYLILYYPGNDRKTIEEKQNELEEIRKDNADLLSRYQIETYWINCSRKRPPSKR